jgi:Flp pilus assembly protein TadG
MIARLLERFRRDASGMVLAETAVAMTILTFTTLAGIEIGRYVLLIQKLDRVAAATADLTAQGSSISVADLNNLFAAAGEIIKPFSLTATGTVIVSSVSAVGANPPRVDWQRVGAGGLSVPSAVGATGANAVLPADFVVRSGEEVIVSEVYYDFTPWLAPNVAPPVRLYNRAFFRPRQGSLTTLLP